MWTGTGDSFTRVGVMWFWKRNFDELMVFTWRPFLDCERWRENLQLHWAWSEMWLFGRIVYAIEHYVSHRVVRQFGDVQDIAGHE